MQMQGSLPLDLRYRTSLHATVGIVWKEGVFGLYHGHAVNTSREVVFLSTYFSVYEHTKTSIASVVYKAIAIPLAGGLSGAAGWVISFPLDCVKSHIQTHSTANSKLTFLPTLIQIIKSKGIVGLYSGLLPSVLRAFIVSSSRFSAYETTLWLLSNKS